MATLSESKCEACRNDSPRISDAEAAQLHAEIPQWRLIAQEEPKQLEREFTFRNFADALKFTQQVGQLAEQEGHHPELCTGWGRVKVTWWTHKIEGLHHNDFVMAAKTDELYEQMQGS